MTHVESPCGRGLSPLDFDMHGDEIGATIPAVDDHATVRQYLSDWGDASWAKPHNTEYVELVVARSGRRGRVRGVRCVAVSRPTG